MFDLLARILNNGTRKSWLQAHPNAVQTENRLTPNGRTITYRDGAERATYQTDGIGNVQSLKVERG